MPRRKKPRQLARTYQAPPQQAVPVQRLDSPQAMARMSRTEVSFHQGPIPDPETLARYDELVPSGAERIFVIMENQVNHRIRMEDFVTRRDSRRADWGVITATLITLAFLIASFVLVYLGHDTAGVALGGTSLVALASVFVYGTTQRSRERAQKSQAVPPQKK